jgi:hypothetical protein
LEEFLPNEPWFSMEKINWNTKYKVWDFVTTSTYNPKTKKENRHIWIVTEIWQNGEPLKITHSSYSMGGVVETDFSAFTKKWKSKLNNIIRFSWKQYLAKLKAQKTRLA